MNTLNDDLIQKLHDLSNDDELYDEGEQRPAASTISLAEEILVKSGDAIWRAGVTDVDIHPLDGSIRIIWNRGRKTLKLVVYPFGTSYIYYLDGDENDLIFNTSKEEVDRWLNWLSADSY